MLPEYRVVVMSLLSFITSNAAVLEAMSHLNRKLSVAFQALKVGHEPDKGREELVALEETDNISFPFHQLGRHATMEPIEYNPEMFYFIVCGTCQISPVASNNAIGNILKTFISNFNHSLLRRHRDAGSSRLVWLDIPGAGTKTVAEQRYFNDQGLFVIESMVMVDGVHIRRITNDFLEVTDYYSFQIPSESPMVLGESSKRAMKVDLVRSRFCSWGVEVRRSGKRCRIWQGACEERRNNKLISAERMVATMVWTGNSQISASLNNTNVQDDCMFQETKRKSKRKVKRKVKRNAQEYVASFRKNRTTCMSISVDQVLAPNSSSAFFSDFEKLPTDAHLGHQLAVLTGSDSMCPSLEPDEHEWQLTVLDNSVENENEGLNSGSSPTDKSEAEETTRSGTETRSKTRSTAFQVFPPPSIASQKTRSAQPKRPMISKYYGVRFRPDLNKWVGEVRVAEGKEVDKKVWLGTYDTEEDAARGMDSARKLLKCKKKRDYNLPCPELEAYSGQIRSVISLTDVATNSMFKAATDFGKRECQEYAASIHSSATSSNPQPNPTLIQQTPSTPKDIGSQFMAWQTNSLDSEVLDKEMVAKHSDSDPTIMHSYYDSISIDNYLPGTFDTEGAARAVDYPSKLTEITGIRDDSTLEGVTLFVKRKAQEYAASLYRNIQSSYNLSISLDKSSEQPRKEDDQSRKLPQDASLETVKAVLTGSDSMCPSLEPDCHEWCSNELESFVEELSDDMDMDIDESETEVTADSPCLETNSSYSNKKRKNTDNDDLITKLAPLIKQQIEDALTTTLLPLVSVLRSREEDEQKHRETLLALEEKKLALEREKLLFKRHRVALSQPNPSASPSPRSGHKKHGHGHGIRVKSSASFTRL